MDLVLSLPVVLAGALLLLLPWWLLPVCDVAAGAAPMRCYWSGRMVSALGVAILVAGVLLFAVRASGFRQGVGLMVVVLAALTAAVPTVLIGMCGNPSMPCRLGTFPASVIFSVLSGLAGLFAVWLSGRRDCGVEEGKS